MKPRMNAAMTTNSVLSSNWMNLTPMSEKIALRRDHHLSWPEWIPMQTLDPSFLQHGCGIIVFFTRIILRQFQTNGDTERRKGKSKNHHLELKRSSRAEWYLVSWPVHAFCEEPIEAELAATAHRTSLKADSATRARVNRNGIHFQNACEHPKTITTH